MEDFVERVVRRLRDGRGFSRNRHYATFSSPEGKRALRIHRHLRSIEWDLSRGSRVSVEREAARVRLTLRSKGGLRTAYLTEAEFRLLCTSPLVKAGQVGS